MPGFPVGRVVTEREPKQKQVENLLADQKIKKKKKERNIKTNFSLI